MKYVERARGLNGGEWYLHPLVNDAEALYQFEVAGKVVAKLGGVTVNNYRENDGLIGKWRAHGAADLRSGSMDSETVLPFGREITVQRNISCGYGYAKVTVDVNGDVVRNLDLDDIILPGNWNNVQVYDLETSKSWPLNAENSSIEFALPMAALTFTAADGRQFEMGCADDFWRYAAPEALGAAPAVIVLEWSPEQTVIKRRIIAVPDSVEVWQNRPWRFSWFFAWPVAAAVTQADDAVIIDVNKLEISDNAFRMSADGGRSDSGCLLTAAMRRALRKAVRTNCNANLVFSNVSTALCFDAAHLERPKKQVLAHWDLCELFELNLWATKQLAANGAAFRLEFAESKQLNLLVVKALQITPQATVKVGEYE